MEAGQGVTGGSQCRKKSPSLVLPEQSAGVSPQRFDRVTLRIASWAGTGSALWTVSYTHLGRDYGATVEIVSGLRASDAIIVDPSDSLISGTPVRIAAGSSK